MTDYIDSMVWGDYKNSDYDCYNYQLSSLFDPSSYTYNEECPINEICDSLANGTFLIRVKRTIYDYSFIIIRKDNGQTTYAELEDESLGKLYIIYIKKIRSNINEVTDYCINNVKNDGNIENLAVLKKIHLPLMWEKLLNYMSIEIPFVCNSKYYGTECPFEEERRGFRYVSCTCNHSWQVRCPHRYYMYNTNYELFNPIALSLIFLNKLKFNHNQHQKFQI